MNLHGIVAPIIGVVNPNVVIPLKRQNGTYTTLADGTRIPNYDNLSGLAQIQAASNKDIQHAFSLNIQGNFRSVYLYGAWFGIVRLGQKGGDILTFEGADWLCVISAEKWPDWSRVLVCQQVT